MNKILTIIILSMLWLAVLPFSAKHSDEFLLGTYSYLKNGTKVDYPNRMSLCKNMQKLGYNSNLIETENNDPDLVGLLAELDNHGIDAWISDRTWNKSLSSEFRSASYPLSTSNYTRFEAEFDSERDVRAGDGMDNSFWYASRSDENITRVGRPIPAAYASYDHVWQARSSSDKPGYIFTDLRYRWPNNNGAYVRFGKEFILYQIHPPTHENDYLWVDFRFKVSEITTGLEDTDPLLSFSLSGYELSGGGFSSQNNVINHKNRDELLPESVYRVRDYKADMAYGDFITLQLKVSYADLIAANLLTADIDGNPATAASTQLLKLINLNPRIYWYGNCDIQIDYVEIADQIHHELATERNVWQQRITDRMQKLISQGSGNVSGFYTFDEPYAGQFDSYKLLQDMLQKEDLKMFTAVYDYQSENYVLDKSNKVYYDHVDNFRKRAQPLILAPDIYPIAPGVKLNKATKGDFIQEVIDNKLLKVYQDSKTYCLEDAQRKFYPIVQVLGKWDKLSGKEQWSNWIQPPTATQKALLYLPLCYGPEGIIHFRLRAFQNPEGYGDRAVMFSRQGSPTYPIPVEDPVSWPAVASTNPKVLVYGRIIQDLTWFKAESIGTQAVYGSQIPNKSLLRSLQVKKTGIGNYEGYIQTAFYLDEESVPYIMVVNRRGNYFSPEGIEDERYVPEADYAKYFPEAEPQTLIIEFSQAANKRFGQNLALFDPADSRLYPVKGRKINLVIPAGEGKLLKMVNTLPPKTMGKYELKEDTVLGGRVTLMKGSQISMQKNTELILLPGSQLVVDQGASLCLNGSVTLMGNAQLIVLGNLENKSISLSQSSQDQIKVMR